MSHAKVAGALIQRPSMPRTKLAFTPPPRACDCHTHVFGPYAQFPLATGRSYTPPEASQAQLAQLLGALGLERVVIVQPSVYGTDNAATLAGVAAFAGRARAVAVIDDNFGAKQLADLHAGGVRGIRINLLTAQEPPPEAATALVRKMAEKIAPLGWHIQLFIRLGLIAALRETLAALPVQVVLDHFGSAQTGSDAGEVNALCALVESGNAYVKLSAAYRMSESGFADTHVAALVRRLINIGPDRMVWGTDWPHPVAFAPAGQPPALHDIDDGLAFNTLAKWANDEAVLKRILVDNPARLYAF